MNTDAVEIKLGNAIIYAATYGDIAILAKKLSGIAASMERVPKIGRNTTQNYDFAREADVVDHIRPQLAKENLYVFFSSEPLATQYEHRTNKNGNNQIWAALELRAIVIDGHSGALISFTMPGQALDTGSDKAIYKAITGAKKYALMTGFNVATGDDPEDRDGGEDKPRRRSAKAAAAQPSEEDQQAAEDRRVKALRQGIVANFAKMRDEKTRHDICEQMFGKGARLSELGEKQLRELYTKLNRGEI